jgi:hypothetical protein
MPSLNPWLQRLLVAWAASTVTTGTLLATAENRYRPKKPKKRRRRRDGGAPRPRPPALPGTVARADAAEGYTPSLTWAEWFVAVQARGRRLLRFVTGQAPLGSVDDDGARLPDEVVTAGGQKVKVAKSAAKKAGKKRSASSRRRGRRQQRQATIYESARESLRQVVKEEAQKAVDETIEEAGLGKARDALKTASEAVGKTAATVAEKVRESIPEDFDEKAKTAGRSLFAGAKRAMQKLGESLQALDTVANAPPPPPVIDVGAPPPADPPPTEARVVDLLATMAALDGEAPATTAPTDTPPGTTTAPPPTDAATITPPAPTDTTQASPPPIDPSAPPGAVDGIGLDELAGKIGNGVQKLGAFLSGPGNPGYQGGGRRPRRAVGDVVEARDAPSTPPSPPPPTDDASH